MRRPFLTAASIGATALVGSCFVNVPDVDTSAETWCETRTPSPLLCADFDRGSFSSGWSEVREDGGGQNSADSTVYQSAPTSYLARTPSLTAGIAHARLCNRFASFPSEMHLALAVRALPPEGSSEAVVASARLVRSDDAAYYVDVRAGATQWRAVQTWQTDVGEVVEGETILAPSPVAGAWTRLSLDVLLVPDGSNSAGSFQVSFDGVNAMGAKAFSLEATSGLAEICTGVVYAAAPNGEWSVYTDDVTFDMVVPPSS